MSVTFAFPTTIKPHCLCNGKCLKLHRSGFSLSSVFRSSQTAQTRSWYPRQVCAPVSDTHLKAICLLVTTQTFAQSPPLLRSRWQNRGQQDPLQGSGWMGSSVTELLRTQEICLLCLHSFGHSHPNSTFLSYPCRSCTIIFLIFCVQLSFIHSLLKVIKKFRRLHSYLCWKGHWYTVHK